MKSIIKYTYQGDEYIPTIYPTSSTNKVLFIDEDLNLAEGTLIEMIDTNESVIVSDDDEMVIANSDLIFADRKFDVDRLVLQVPADEVKETLDSSGYDCLVAISSGFGYYWIFDESGEL